PVKPSIRCIPAPNLLGRCECSKGREGYSRRDLVSTRVWSRSLLLLRLNPPAFLLHRPAGVVFLEAAGLGDILGGDRGLEVAANFLAATHAEPGLRDGFDALRGYLDAAADTRTRFIGYWRSSL